VLKKYYINSIFSRLFISFMLIMIPIYIVGALIFTWSENAIKTEIKNSAISRINFLKNNLESEIVRIKNLQGNFTNDIDLNKLLFSEYKDYPEYEYYMTVSNVRKRLIILKNSSSFINDVIVYIPSLNKTISANEGYFDFIEEDFYKMLTTLQERPYPVIFEDYKHSILMPFPFTISKNSLEKPKYLVEMQLSEKPLENYIADFNTYPDSHIVLFDHTVGKCIIGADNNSNFNEIIEFDAIKKDNSTIVESIIEVKSKEYLMIHGFSDYLNVSLLEFVPVQSIFEIPNRYRKFLAIFFLLSIGILLIYSFSTYKFVHVPIKTILNAFHDVENGNLKVSIRYRKANEFMHLYEGFNKMVFRLDDLIDRVYAQELFAK
jgi:two-component system sensor histidine kinase YesM